MSGATPTRGPDIVTFFEWTFNVLISVSDQLRSGGGLGDMHERLRLQALRTECRVEGFELHDFTANTTFGTAYGPYALWHSVGNNYNPATSRDSDLVRSFKVFACNSHIVQRFGRAIKRRHTLLLGVGVTAIGPVTCGPTHQSFFGFYDPPEGHCKILGGTENVRGQYEGLSTVGVMMFGPGRSEGPANHGVCFLDKYRIPSAHSQQAPVTVFVGMRRSACLAALFREFGPGMGRLIIDAVVSKVVDLAAALVAHLFFPVLGPLIERFLLRRWLTGWIREAARERLAEIVTEPVSDFVSERVRRALDRRVREAGGIPRRQSTEAGLEELFNRWLDP